MEKQPSSVDETASYKEYPPSEIYTTSDPPPAYIKSRHTSVVQVARIAAYTLVAVSFILGSFILASSYVTATLSCQEYQQYPQEYIEDRLPRFQGLVADPLESEESKHHQIESADQRKDDDKDKKEEQAVDDEKDKAKDDQQQTDDSEQDEQEFKFKLPIHLDLDALTGALLEGNSKSKMNCVVEKQKSEEVLNKDQRELITFGLDLAALDPGLKHITGERLAIVCETSREAPKETQANHIILPFPLPGFHHVPQRMMPHPMQQRMMPHFMPQHQPRVQMPMPFFRPNPFQNFAPRPQHPAFPRRNGVEEIPILVLEDESRLQNLVELPRHPQNLFEVPRPSAPQPHNLMHQAQPQAHPQVQVHPQIQVHPQVHNILEMARGAVPSVQNVVEIPEPKMQPFEIHEARPLPPWAARAEPQEQVVQIQAMPAMVRPPQAARSVQVEARPFQVDSATIQVDGRSIQVEQRPMQEHRSVQVEQRTDRRPEGRSFPIDGHFNEPSDMMKPPPPPFEMDEPSRPHFVQPRSIRCVNNPRQDKLESRCA